MKNLRRFAYLLLISAAMPAAAWAQSAALASSGEDENVDEAAGSRSGEIIVTATKRGENVQDIPASVTAMTGETLSQQGLKDLKDISTAIPNLNFGENNGTTMLTIRGVGSTIDSGVTEPTVAMYVDGVFLPRATIATLRAIDLERVEVLRGPQGTLYGRNATGGAINFISAAPTRSFSGGATFSTGSRDALGVSGFLSGPITDGVYFRVSGGHEEQDGYVRVVNTGQLLNGTDVNFVRGALRFEPSDTVTIDLAARYERSTAATAYNEPITPSPLAPPGLQTTEINRIIADREFDQEVETFIANATVNWDVSDSVTLRSITSYVKHHSFLSFDAEGTGVDFYNVPSKQFRRPSESYAQEFNLVGDSDQLKWILGAYYFHEDAGNSLPVRIGTVGSLVFGLPVETILGQAVDTTSKSWALFGDATYSVTDRLRLGLGLRYNNEDQDFAQTFFISGVVPTTVVPFSYSKNKLLPKLSLQYDFTPDVMGYAQWSKGYKSGGANLPGGGGELLGQTLGFYQPELIDAYEAGLKTQLANRTITANLAAYYYDYSNLQVTVVVPPAATQVNNADAKVYGAEMDLTWRPNDSFDLLVAAAYTHGRFDNFISRDSATGQLVNLDGKPLPHAPDLTANVLASYRIPLGGELLSSLTLRGGVKYSDRVVLRYFGTPEDSQEAYALINLSATLANVDDNIQLRGFVNNVTNKVYKLNVANFGLGNYYGIYSEPREWGVELSYRF